jgi:hypothetical protein
MKYEGLYFLHDIEEFVDHDQAKLHYQEQVTQYVCLYDRCDNLQIFTDQIYSMMMQTLTWPSSHRTFVLKIIYIVVRGLQ